MYKKDTYYSEVGMAFMILDRFRIIYNFLKFLDLTTVCVVIDINAEYRSKKNRQISF